MRFYGAAYSNIERGVAEFNITVLCSIKPHIERGLQHISIALYRYVCKHIVGSEEAVQTKRLLMTMNDNIRDYTFCTRITSGSYGEGLEMKGSDYDIMYVLKLIQVYNNLDEPKRNPFNIYFKASTDDTQPGFVKLRPVNIRQNVIIKCVESDGKLYLSNKTLTENMKALYSIFFPVLTHGIEVLHGPCMSNKDGDYDFAFCLQSRSWIDQAEHWKTRPNSSWPSHDVRSNVIKHGVLFVPIGVKGSPNEEIEWRVSFSVGEKLLIYSFTHTQLLCYALMKILLKDVIGLNETCKNLLCSYYIKNIIFWVSEELPRSVWQPKNLINCFMQCFKRLLYCVEYSFCPHYFIPENNMFENKIEGENRSILLDNLRTLYTFHWKMVLFSKQLRNFRNIMRFPSSKAELFVQQYEQLNMSVGLFIWDSNAYVKSSATQMGDILSKINLKPYNAFYLSLACNKMDTFVAFDKITSNKEMFDVFKKSQALPLIGIHADAISGWLKLASFFYGMKQYIKALEVLRYSLSKSTKTGIKVLSKLSLEQRELLSSKALQSAGIIRTRKLLCLGPVRFAFHSTLIPHELHHGVMCSFYMFEPIVYTHFLCFLCNFHLHNTRQLLNSLENLQRSVKKVAMCTSYNCLGVALQLIGDKRSARKAFKKAIIEDPFIEKLAQSYIGTTI